MVYKFFDKKSKGDSIKNKFKENQHLANEIHLLEDLKKVRCMDRIKVILLV